VGTGPLLDHAVIELLAHVHNRGVVPCIPSKGSVSACGDLAPPARLLEAAANSAARLAAPNPSASRTMAGLSLVDKVIG
jgi:histidine ammonia-lyase